MGQKLKRHLVSGVLILVPLILTYFSFHLLLRFINDNLSIPFGRLLISGVRLLTGAGAEPAPELPAFWASMVGIVLLALFTFLIGVLGSSLLGRQIFLATEGLIEQIPVFKSVYATLKQVTSEFSPKERRSFRKVVLVSSPDGKHNLGFLTGQTCLSRDGREEPVRSVYLPTNHLWFGEVRIVPARDVLETDLTVEQGISFILSCGASVPGRVGQAPPSAQAPRA